jgi:hypothetical protein
VRFAAFFVLMSACSHPLFQASNGGSDVFDNTSGCPAFAELVICPVDASDNVTCDPIITWPKFEGDARASIGCEIMTATPSGDGGCIYEQTTCTAFDGGAAWVSTTQ